MMKKRIIILFLFALTILAQSVVFAAYPMSCKDDRGKTIRFVSKPVRIISLTPAITETLFAIGLSHRIVGVSDMSNYPEEAKRKVRVGSVQLNIEKIVSLKPDLVVADSHLNASIIPRLEKLGITVFVLRLRTLADVRASVVKLGKITSRPRSAGKVCDKIDRAFAKVKSRSKTDKKVLVLVQFSPVWVAGENTYIDEMIRLCGAKNAIKAKKGFVSISLESAVVTNPDVIIVCTKGDDKLVKKSSAWKKTKAVKTKKVYYIDSDLTTRPSPRIVEGCRLVFDCIR